MRIAVFSDVHGFSLALETVLDDLEATGPYDEIVFAGDLCEGGPDPAGAIESIRDRAITPLQGNTDADLVASTHHGWGGSESNRFALEQIGEEGIAFLEGLALSRRITPPGGVSPDDDLLVVHANPHDLHEKLLPDASAEELRAVIGDAQFAALAFGHHHVCYTRQLDGRLLIDVSAVGNPKDGDLRCKYGVLTWDADAKRWSAELRRLPYPLEATREQILDSGLPNPEKTLRNLIKASY